MENRILPIVVVGSDPELPQEFEAALAGTKVRAVVHHASDLRRGAELVRSRQPELVLFPLSDDLQALKNFTDEVASAAPGAAIAATFRREAFGPEASEGAILIEAMRCGVQDFLRRPLSSADLKGLLDRLEKKGHKAPAKLGKVVCFVSNKGGVGKTTLAVNAAAELAQRHPDRVLLVDASLQVGHCAATLDLEPETTIHDAIRQWDRLDETLVRQLSVPHASGLRLLAAPRDAFHATEITAEGVARIVSLARRAFDYVIVDTFPLIDAVVLAVLDMADRVFVVVHPAVPTVLGIARFLELLDRVGVPVDRQSLVLNHNQPTFMGSLREADVAERLGRTIDHVIPFHKQVLVAANTGEPYVLNASRFFGAGPAVREVARAIEGVTATPRPVKDAPANGAEVPEAEAAS